MLKGIFTKGTLIASNEDIPFRLAWNTNPKVVYNPLDKSVLILKPGCYKVFVSIPLTTISSTQSRLQLFANGVPIEGSVTGESLDIPSGEYIYSVCDWIRVFPSEFTGPAKLTVRLVGATAEVFTQGMIIVQEV